ncbi:hypothetical protein JTE90_007431 [Oedothorax gibbosus]|uniref:Uncharacterized protein n=1 Tax=Oedothorax gibbosus TaxID=931172 RepID=A0AAV6UNL5_9ARAC|nr:hypothetical protein JTE90_007431 [Oedothorax gibbosus]
MFKVTGILGALDDRESMSVSSVPTTEMPSQVPLRATPVSMPSPIECSTPSIELPVHNQEEAPPQSLASSPKI